MVTHDTDTNRKLIRGAGTDLSGVRARFGGIDTPAALAGMFTALGVLVFLGALIVAGAGGLEYQLNVIDIEGNAQEVACAGAAIAIFVVFASFIVGGWAAGRMARYDGGWNGLAAATWMLFLVAVFAVLGVYAGAEYNAFQQAGLPDWFSQLRGDDVTVGAVLAGVVAIIAMFGGAYIGGRLGEAYHAKVDAAVADAQPIVEVQR